MKNYKLCTMACSITIYGKSKHQAGADDIKEVMHTHCIVNKISFNNESQFP
jgi:hypothetical protein